MIENMENVAITDFHSHILPKMDDGSSSVEESVAMLKLLHAQGVDLVVATPHFYPDVEDPESFFKRRERSVQTLSAAICSPEFDADNIPKICIGAEVAYFSGMSLYKKIKDLCIKGTNVMLLEMPFYEWSDMVVNEVCKMQDELGIVVVLAHIDRYYRFFDNAKLLKLRSHGVLMQINADSFLSFMSLKKAIKLLHSNHIGALGSDCHNMTIRPSKMDKAMEIMRSKGHASELMLVMQNAQAMLAGAEFLL